MKIDHRISSMGNDEMEKIGNDPKIPPYWWDEVSVEIMMCISAFAKTGGFNEFRQNLSQLLQDFSRQTPLKTLSIIETLPSYAMSIALV